MAEDLGERTEAPTPRRLFEARDRGQVARSAELGAAIDMIGAAIALALLGGLIATTFGALLRSVLAGLHQSLTFETLLPVIKLAGVQTAKVLGPVVLAIILTAALAQYVQVGWHPTLKPLAPKLEKLNPVRGFMNLFGRRNAVKSAVNVLKLMVVVGVSYKFLSGAVARLAGLPALESQQAFLEVARLAGELTILLLALLLVLGLADYLFQRWQHTQDLRMSRSEIKDERRSMEGDPQIKSRRFRMAQKIAMQRVHAAVPKADVVVTNPTHFSVALRYDQSSMRAPRVVAKGTDALAQRIRELAALHAVPIVERPPLARALYAGVEVGQEIRPEHYKAVAEVLAFVYRLEREASEGAPPRGDPEPALEEVGA